MSGSVRILGIETSCDETAAAVVQDGREVLSNVVASQVNLHARFGGIVPEIACRAHVEAVVPVVDRALEEAGMRPEAIDAVAVTTSPGLIGALLVGVAYAKAMALALDKPIYGVDHIYAHMYANRMAFPEIRYPIVNLVVSGGHTNLYLSRGPLDHELLGQTRDDAAGEAFDKVAKVLGLPFPGGPAIDRISRGRDPNRVPFKRSLLEDGYDFSFSGLKTAVLYAAWGQDARDRGRKTLSPELVADLAAGFQEAVVDILVEKSLRACRDRGVRRLAVGGGVACNTRLRARFAERAREEGVETFFPPPAWCTDNAAMIAGLGFHRMQAGPPDGLDLDALPTRDYRARG